MKKSMSIVISDTLIAFELKTSLILLTQLAFKQTQMVIIINISFLHGLTIMTTQYVIFKAMSLSDKSTETYWSSRNSAR